MSDAHPLELVFDLEPGSTTTGGEYSPPVATTTVVPISPDGDPSALSASYDSRDDQINAELENVRQQAMDLANQLQSGLEFVDPKQLPRIGEVTIQALNSALEAIKQKADIKKHKDKLRAPTVTSIHTTTNNTMVVDRKELLRRSKSREIV